MEEVFKGEIKVDADVGDSHAVVRTGRSEDCLRELLDMMSASEGEGGHVKADVEREVA